MAIFAVMSPGKITAPMSPFPTCCRNLVTHLTNMPHGAMLGLRTSCMVNAFSQGDRLMCHHFVRFHTHQPLHASRALWRCSTCGRASSMPIDCCTQPSFASVRQPSIARLCLRWLGSQGYQMLTSMRAICHRRRQPAFDAVMMPDHERLSVSDMGTVETVTDCQRSETQTESIVETTCVSV